MYKCRKDSLTGLLDKIAEKYELFVPVKREKDRVSSFEKYRGDVYLDRNADKGVKELFFPQTEEIARFCTEGGLTVKEAEPQNDDFAVFGARACDIRGLELLDLVFLSEPSDALYAKRREHGVIISAACDNPSEACFCTCFGIDPAKSGDISAVSSGDSYYFEILTAKGKKLDQIFASVCVTAEADEIEKEREKLRKKAASTPAAAAGARLPEKTTEELFELPVWEKLSSHCLGCGSCTFVCPTCQCYDIKDIKTKDGAVRCRVWDSCMYSDFTKMSAGQPRLTQKERFRQRFMHKLVYFRELYGEYGCVGCGRCVYKCPVSMNMIKVIKEPGISKNE